MLGDIAAAAAEKAKNVRAQQPAANAPQAKTQVPEAANAEVVSSAPDVKEPEIDPDKQLKSWKNQERLLTANPSMYPVGYQDMVKKEIAKWAAEVKVHKPLQSQYQAAADGKNKTFKALEEGLLAEAEAKSKWEQLHEALMEKRQNLIDAEVKEKEILTLMKVEEEAEPALAQAEAPELFAALIRQMKKNNQARTTSRA